MPWAVSGRRYTIEVASSTGPMWVLNIRLNCRGSVSCPPHSGHSRLAHSSSGMASVRKRCLHFLQSTSGSWKFSTCPEASHTRGCIRMAASRPTMLSCSWVICFHQKRWMLFFSSTPSGP